MATVYVKETCVTQTDDGTLVTLKRGEAWDSDASVVKAHRGLFEAEPQVVQGRIERATRAPGEKRGPGRPRKVQD